MKTTFFIFLCIISSMAFSQNNRIIKMEDGRSVLLKSNFTWEYIDAEKTLIDSTSINLKKLEDKNSCSISKDFSEPELDSNIQAQLKRGRATIDHIKKKVAKHNKCDVANVILLVVSETKASGTYIFCANGTKVSYKRNGHALIKNRKLF